MPFKNINLDYKIISENNIPLLVDNPEWKILFDDIKDKELESAKINLKEKIRFQKEVKIKQKKLKDKKRKNMIKIVNLSHIVNNGEKKAIKKLESARKEIVEINTKIEELQYELDFIPSEIRKANFALLNITIKIAYGNLKSNEEKLNYINEKILTLRIKLKKLIEEKNDYEENINNSYKFLHGIIGKKEIEKLDEKFFE